MSQSERLSELLSNRQRGLFVAFEGPDGSGKTTQLELLQCRLKAPVLYTREPGGTALGRELRRLVMHGPEDIDARTEALLYAADRAYHAATVIRPALDEGKTVITDRYIDSSVAYQGLGRGLGEQTIKDLSLWATGGLLPDLVVILDVEPGVAATRRGDARDRIESAGQDFQASVRAHYLAAAGAEAGRYAVIDAAASPEEVFSQVVDALLRSAE